MTNGPVAGFWWVGRPNFGDLLTPLLLERFSDTSARWCPAAEANLFCVGSILEAVPKGSKAFVVGSGKMFERTVPNLGSAKVLALRGPLTARGIRGSFALGDPGLLADELVTVDKEYNLGIVPHWSDTDLEHRPEFRRYKPRIIRPDDDPIRVIREIGRCRKIVASSLHGIIVADAFGIPRRTEMTPAFAREGGDFKFRDHSAAVGVPFEIGLTQAAPRYIVQDRQHELFDVFASLGRQLMGQA